MELKVYIVFIKRWFWLIALAAISSSMTAAVISRFFIEKTYEASATILISKPKADSGNNSLSYNDILPNADLSKVYSRVAQSDAAVQHVIDYLKIDYTYDNLKKHIKVVNDEETGIIKLSASDRDAYISQQIVNLLINNLKEQTEKIGLIDNMHIIDNAKLPLLPSSPNTALNILIASVAGVFAGLMLAVMLNSLDNTISDIKILKSISLLPVLGVIPRFGKKINSSKGSILSGVCTEKDEIFRLLRTNVLDACDNIPGKVLLVTSPGVSEGKTTVASNLALSLSHLGRRVLLIDANKRSPAMNDLFKLVCTDGLFNYLSGGEDAKLSICTEVKSNLHILMRGHTDSNSADLLASPRMVSLIEDIKESYDVIIIDSPALLKYADAAIVSALADGIILTVSYGRTTYEMVRITKETILSINKKFIGLVINNFTV